MAGRLIDAGEDVTVWNRTRPRPGHLAAAGAVVADTLPTWAGRRRVRHGVHPERPGRGGLRGAAACSARRRSCPKVDRGLLDRVRGGFGPGARSSDRPGVGFLAAPVSGNPHVVAEGAAAASSRPARARCFAAGRTWRRSRSPPCGPERMSRPGWSSCATTSISG